MCLVVDVSLSHIIRYRIQNPRTYIRSLIRDIGYELDSCATTTSLERSVSFAGNGVYLGQLSCIRYIVSHIIITSLLHTLHFLPDAWHDRTQQAQFSLEDSLERDDWTADNIYAAIDRLNLVKDA